MPADDLRAAVSARTKSHWADTIEHAHARIGDAINAKKKEHLTDILEQFESDLAPHIAERLHDAMAHPDFPDVLRPLLTEIAGPTNLTSSLTVGIAVGAIISPALGAAFAPFISELADQVWTKFPTMELSPDLAAAGVLKGVLSESEGAREAITSGVNAQRFGTMVEIAGQAIGLQDALLLWRRGQITDDHLTEIIRYSNLNPKFYDDVRKLRYAPPSTAAVLGGLVEGHLSEGEAREKFQEAGGNPENFDWQHETTGRPPGAEMLLNLLNRGFVTEDFARAAIRESDIKNKYIDAIIESRVYLPPPRSIVPMLRHGAISEARARELLTDHGLRSEDVEAFIAEANYSATTAGKELTQSQVVRMYGEQFIDRGTAQARLAALRLPADEITLLLDFTDDQRRERYLNAALTRVRTLYVGHKIGKPLATSTMQQLGLPGNAITDVFSIWDIERETSAPNLTVAQWQGAFRRGLVSHAEFDAAMTRFGYTLDEAEILAGLAFPPPKAPKPPNSKDLTAAQLVKLWQAGEIPPDELHTRLMGLGYSAAEANEVASLAKAPA